MTIYYTLTFFILVVEMISFGILVLPLPSRLRRGLFTFISTSPIVAKAIYVLKIVFAFIFVLFIDTVNRLQRIDTEKEEEGHHYDYGYEANLKAKKFYAQRNLYLTGFTLFLSLILERTSALVIEMLRHEEALKGVKTETASASKEKGRLVDAEQDYKRKIASLTEELDDLKRQERDFETLKKQVAQQTAEFNRLADEKNALENQLGGKKEGKKDI